MAVIAAIMSQSNPGVEVTAPAPVIEALAADDLQQRACGRKCNVLAWYSPGGIIYYDDRMRPDVNPVARGILLHELVHHVQKQTLGTDSTNCKEWLRREREAYLIQSQWLFNNGIDPASLSWQIKTLQCHPMAFGGGQAQRAPQSEE